MIDQRLLSMELIRKPRQPRRKATIGIQGNGYIFDIVFNLQSNLISDNEFLKLNFCEPWLTNIDLVKQGSINLIKCLQV